MAAKNQLRLFWLNRFEFWHVSLLFVQFVLPKIQRYMNLYVFLKFNYFYKYTVYYTQSKYIDCIRFELSNECHLQSVHSWNSKLVWNFPMPPNHKEIKISYLSLRIDSSPFLISNLQCPFDYALLHESIWFLLKRKLYWISSKNEQVQLAKKTYLEK